MFLFHIEREKLKNLQVTDSGEDMLSSTSKCVELVD